MGYALTSNAEGGVVFYGESENLPLTDGDRSIHARVHLGNVEEVSHMWRVGRLRLAIIDVGTDDFRFAAIKEFAGGSITAISTTEVAEDTTYSVYAMWDRATATVSIVVDGTEEDTAEDAANYINTPNLPTYSASLPGASWGTEWAAWAKLVNLPSQPSGYVSNHGAGQSDVDVSSLPDGCLMVAITASNQPMVTPDGWSLEGTINTSAVDLTIYTRIKQSGDGVVTFDMSGSNLGTMALVIGYAGATDITLGTSSNVASGSITVPDAPSDAGRRCFVYATGFGTSGQHEFDYTGYPDGYDVHAAGARFNATNRYRIEVGSQADNGTDGFSLSAGADFKTATSFTVT